MSKLKLLFAAAIALVAFAAMASSASALTARVESGGSISSASLGKVTFGGSSITIECNLTLNGRLNTSVSLAVGSTLGTTTEVRIANCTGGSVSGVLNLPWQLVINEILTSGGAPTTENLTGLLFEIVNSSFNLSVFGGLVNCLYQGTAGALLEVTKLRAATYSSALLIALETIQIPKHSGSLCPAEGTFAGTFGLSPLQTMTIS